MYPQATITGFICPKTVVFLKNKPQKNQTAEREAQETKLIAK